MRSRQRVHSCTGVTDLAQEVCNTNPGMWMPWGPWEICSVTCGGGTQMRVGNRIGSRCLGNRTNRGSESQ